MHEAARRIAIVILAAGQGTRMKSRRAKVLHELAGQPLLGFALALAEAQAPERLLVVVGRGADEVRQRFAGRAEFVLQDEQRGTGHAVAQAQSALRDFDGEVLILYADVPLLRSETIAAMRTRKRESKAGLVLLSAPVKLPGRVVRDASSGRVLRIVESTDASPQELEIEEGNTGVYLLNAELLWDGLSRLDDQNEQGELYLTDVVDHAVRNGRGVEALCLESGEESLGVNTRAELAAAAAVVRRRTAERLMAEGVTLVDPDHTYIDVGVQVGRDSVIEPGCLIQGETEIGEGVWVKAHCTIESSILGDGVVIGPCAHLRPGTRLGKHVRIGNFVEIKNSDLGTGVKADHLTYIGDADVGPGASFGCGAITVNYDWKSKSRTHVGAGARIGCNANLLAPVSVATRACVAAGSTIARDVPVDALAVARPKQRNIEGWVARRAGRSTAPTPRSAGDSPKASTARRKKTAAKKSPRKKAARGKTKRNRAEKTARTKSAGKKRAGARAGTRKSTGRPKR